MQYRRKHHDCSWREKIQRFFVAITFIARCQVLFHINEYFSKIQLNYHSNASVAIAGWLGRATEINM